MRNSWKKLAEAYTAATLNNLPRIAGRRFPEVFWMGQPGGQRIALSFDDGPDPRDTPAVLEVLARHQVTATFAWLGEKIEAQPDMVRAATVAGHQVMSHGYRHRSFLFEKQLELRVMLDHTRLLISELAGVDPALVRSLRPPFGHLSGPLLRALLDWGYRPVLGSIMPVHWLQPVQLTVRQVVVQAEDGALIVLHESLGGPAVAALTDQILTALAPRSFNFVTIDMLRWAP